ncbi:ATP-binding protein [Undibacterium sp.]|jgi:two-component system OmpR family sensor kinase|uniref:ATP-binding protein n=1 Tax=Undibacterium sp. TaxID=1914977 RepID=UPI002CDF8A42|nr:ATP-binding protein [Undibacterium sp.]HTD05174.1 ATP-binding protein [Undibacterium sp.]
MMKSLRVRLILLFGVAIVAAAALQFATSFQAAMREANKLFDYHMQQLVLALQDRDFDLAEWNSLPGIEGNDFDFVVQVWSADGMQVYQSRRYSSLPKQAGVGYSTVTLDNGDWRVYTVQEHKRVVQVAQKIRARRDRAITLAFSALWPVIPVSLLLFAVAWWVVTSALAPLNRIGQELADRSADSMEPVSDAGVPQEVSLLVTELNSLLARTAQALQSQQRFVADAAHELRSPITALRLQVQTLARSRDELALDLAVGRLLGGVDRASRLVEQLLALARQDPSSQNNDLAPLSLSACVEQAMSDVGPFAASRGIQLQSGPLPQAQVLGDADSLRVMICNLLDNAVRYIPENGIVQIGLDVAGAQVDLTVQDSGGGIRLPERTRIFDRFYRVPGTSPSGSGLGLAIAKTIADRHRATILLGDSVLGGLAVKISFPAQL